MDCNSPHRVRCLVTLSTFTETSPYPAVPSICQWSLMTLTWLISWRVSVGLYSGSRLAGLVGEVLQNQIQARPGEMPNNALFGSCTYTSLGPPQSTGYMDRSWPRVSLSVPCSSMSVAALPTNKPTEVPVPGQVLLFNLFHGMRSPPSSSSSVLFFEKERMSPMRICRVPRDWRQRRMTSPPQTVSSYFFIMLCYTVTCMLYPSEIHLSSESETYHSYTVRACFQHK